jgi:hypothetical protein
MKPGLLNDILDGSLEPPKKSKGSKAKDSRSVVGGRSPDIQGADRALIYSVLLIRYLRENPGIQPQGETLATLGINANYGAKIVTKLVTAGFLHSRTGKGGGIQLATHRPIPVNELRKLHGLAVILFTEV